MLGGIRLSHPALRASALVLVALAAAAPSAAATRIEAPARPPKVVVIPPDVRIYQLSAATMLEVPEWSEEGEAHADGALIQLLDSNPGFERVDLPTLSAEEQAIVDEHVALYDLVSASAQQAVTLGGQAWKHKRTGFDYTLGPGLRFLRERTGADQALFTIAADTEVTGGRVGMAFLAAAAGVAIPMGNTFISMGLVDLETGDIDWLNHRLAGTNLRDKDNVLRYFDDVLCAYPNGRVSGGKVRSCGRQFKDGVPKAKR
jgi:hypothetical protein